MNDFEILVEEQNDLVLSVEETDQFEIVIE